MEIKRGKEKAFGTKYPSFFKLLVAGNIFDRPWIFFTALNLITGLARLMWERANKLHASPVRYFPCSSVGTDLNKQPGNPPPYTPLCRHITVLTTVLTVRCRCETDRWLTVCGPIWVELILKQCLILCVPVVQDHQLRPHSAPDHCVWTGGVPRSPSR